MTAAIGSSDPVTAADPAQFEKFRWHIASVLTGLFGFGLYDQAMLPEVAEALKATGRVQEDPFGRAIRTAVADQLAFWGTAADRDAEFARLRTLHRDVKGAMPDGSRYSAFKPENWNWIMVSTFFFLHNTYEPLTGEALTPQDQQVFWEFYTDATSGLHLSGPAVLPATFTEASEYYDMMVETRLESTDLLRDVVDILLHPPRPGFVPTIAAPLWLVLGPVCGHALAVMSFGAMRENARELTGFGWNPLHEVEYRVLIKGAQLAYRYLPKRLQYSPMAYNRWCYEQLSAKYHSLELKSFAAERRRTTGCPV